jgi:hypothetical protein
MGIETGGEGAGENPDNQKPPQQNQSSGEDQARLDENRPFRLFKDPKSPTNWWLEGELEGTRWRTPYGLGGPSITRQEFIERIRKGIQIDKEHRQRQNPEHGFDPNQ